MADKFPIKKLHLLQQAEEVVYPFPVTGFLLDAMLLGGICVGRIFNHFRAHPESGRFANGHLMHTSYVVGYGEYEGFIVIKTQNSIYVCVTTVDDRATFISDILSLARPTYH